MIILTSKKSFKMYKKSCVFIIFIITIITANTKTLYASQILDKIDKSNNSLQNNKQLQTSDEFVCGGLKIITSNSQGQTRLRVYVEKALIGFTKEFDVTRRDSDGQIVSTNKTDLAPGVNGEETTSDIIFAFDEYSAIARDRVCRSG